MEIPGMLLLLWLAGCSSFGIYQPANNATVASPAGVVIQWKPDQTTPGLKVTVDGTDRTNEFSISASGATASLVLTAGQHSIRATAQIYDPFYQKAIAQDTTVTVTVPGPDFTISATDLSIARNSTGALAISVVPSNGFMSPVSVSPGPTPTGVTVTTATVTPPATTASLPVQAARTAPLSSSSVQVSGTSGSLMRSTSAKLKVIAAAGPFVQASFAVTVPPASATSPDGTVPLTALTGTSAANPSAYVARFGSGAATKDIGYNLGQSVVNNQITNLAYGGAGFCPASLAGFVIAGVGPGVVSALPYVVTLFDFSSRATKTVDASSIQPYPLPSTAPPNGYYGLDPVVYFSPDCSLAIVVGADPLGPSKNAATFIDVTTAKQLGNRSFNGPLSAAVTASGDLSFTADNQTTTYTP
jgi:hypothetical protein